MYAYGPYRPDQPPTVGGVTRYAKSVVPYRDDASGIFYGPYPSFEVPSGAEAAGESPKGAISLVNSSGTYQVYVGQSTTIEQVAADWTLDDVDTGLSLTSGDDWSFEHYGAYLVATNTTEGMWNYNVDSGSGAGAVSNAPAAREIFVSNEALVALDCDGNNLRWQNCALGDHTNWSTLEANGDELEDGGPLIVGRHLLNANAIVLQSEAVRLFQFGGGASLISVVKLADGIGSVGARSFTVFNGIAYWLDERGFFASAGGRPQAIGDGKVDRTFLEMVPADERDTVQAEVDPERKLVIWRYGTTGIAYSWAVNEWGPLTLNVSYLLRVVSPGYTMDNASAFGNVDTVPYGPDSSFWQGGAKSMGGFSTDFKIGLFSGSNLAAEIATPVINRPASELIYAATPITDDSASTLAIGTSDVLSASISYGDDVAKNEAGWCPIDGRGQNIGLLSKHAAGASWTYDRGVDHINDMRP